MFAARKHSVIMSVNFMFTSDERGVIVDRCRSGASSAK